MNYNGHFTHEFDRCQSPMPSVSGDSPLASSDATGQSPDTDEGHTDHQLEAAYRGCAFAAAMFLLMLVLCLLLSRRAQRPDSKPAPQSYEIHKSNAVKLGTCLTLNQNAKQQ